VAFWVRWVKFWGFWIGLGHPNPIDA